MRPAHMVALSIALCLALALAAYLTLPHLPSPTLPVHWNGQGHADNFAAAPTVIYAFPIFAAVLSLAFALATPAPGQRRPRRLSTGHAAAWTVALLVVAILEGWMLRSAV